MNKYRPIILLTIAVLFSGIAGFSSIKYLEHREQALIAEYDEKANYTEVIVPIRNLAVGDVVSVDTVSLRPVPAQYLPTGALYPSDFDAIAGLTLKEPAVAGAPLLSNQLDGLTGVDKFSQLLKPGQRALTFPIDDLQSNENMLMPGDYVDVLVKVKGETGGEGSDSVSVSSLLNKVLVLATGVTTVADPSYYQAQANASGYGSITLGVSTRDIPTILAAKDVGELVYLLRNPEDETKGRFSSSDLALGGGSSGRVKVYSSGSAQGGLIKEQYQGGRGATTNRWGNPQDEGRLYKKYEGSLSATSEKEEKVQLSQN